MMGDTAPELFAYTHDIGDSIDWSLFLSDYNNSSATGSTFCTGNCG
jgi:hypothetical protein